ncbi:hypothetical protein [Legionella shakespearei]|uniref:Homoserine kinase type II (Protein kinase fold) n=1 Tax=Legionella shakespearei DSM 23087 TaxID=1122169 RepID=A0A0W0Z2T9_9GAMM|nr:hypothetical protein [Legionella shakespearei]KTD63123.1 homoserine kinase type II (protein kinase fold) [Legionella shakespearei DSM 23087]
MNHFFLRHHAHQAAKILYSFIALAFLLMPVNTWASSIQPYDFDGKFKTITKVWNPEVALYVAKKFAAEHGENEQNVSVTKLNAGATNNFIYLVFIEKQLKFVLKGIGAKEEAEALLLLQEDAQIKNLENNPAAAKVCLSKAVHYYKTTDTRHIYYFAILEAAQGKELFKIMTDALLNTKDINELSDVFYDAGKQISELHKTLIGFDRFITPEQMMTIIHDDFHPENTFYDLGTKKFSLIDNESMAHSITHPMLIVREIYGLYEVPVIRWPSEKISVDLLKDADAHDIATVYIELIKGMASIYQDPKAAASVFTRQIIELNNKSQAFLKDSRSEPWMLNPQDKSETHIVWGKLSHAVWDTKLNNLYQAKLTIINQDMKSYLDSL